MFPIQIGVVGNAAVRETQEDCSEKLVCNLKASKPDGGDDSWSDGNNEEAFGTAVQEATEEFLTGCHFHSYPHCPIFILSKDRSELDKGGTIANLVQDLIPFTVVVEKADEEPYNRLIDALVFRNFGEAHMRYHENDLGTSSKDRFALEDGGEKCSTTDAKCCIRQCACCMDGNFSEYSFKNIISQVYHHGYIFAPLQTREKTVETRSKPFTLVSVDEVRRLFKVHVLPEENKGVSFVRNYILHVLVPQLMVSTYMDETGHLEELDILNPTQTRGISDVILRRWKVDASTMSAIERREKIIEEKNTSPRVHGLVGYYWVLDDDIHSFTMPDGEKIKRISPREMMNQVEKRVLVMEKNIKPSKINTRNGSVFTCKEEALANNYTSLRVAPKATLSGNNFEHLDKTAIISLDYSHFSFFSNTNEEKGIAIAINSYNNIACLFRYDLLHTPIQNAVQYFPPNAVGVRSVKDTLAGYGGSMMWYRFCIREDYDFTLQLISRGLYTVRFRELGFNVPRMAQLKGGMTDYYKNCKDDILEQNTRFVNQWPSISQRCYKGKNETRREDIRVRWDLLNPAKARYPGAYLHLRELLPQISPVVHEKLNTELFTIGPVSRNTERPHRVPEDVSSIKAPPIPEPKEDVEPEPLRRQKAFRSPSSSSSDGSFDGDYRPPKRQKISPAAIPPSSKPTIADGSSTDGWKGFAIVAWREIRPTEAISLGLVPIPVSKLRIGLEVAVIPPDLACSPSLVVATLIEKNITVAKHSSLCGTYDNQDAEVIEWSAVPNKRGMPMLTVIDCYEVPSEPMEEVIKRLDDFFDKAVKNMKKSE